jgi:hypothetical protein
MKKRGCILCGEPTEFDFHNFCDRCFNLSIEEIEERFLKKTTLDVREDQKQPGATEDPCEPCQPKTFYHRSKEFIKGILFFSLLGKSGYLVENLNRERR